MINQITMPSLLEYIINQCNAIIIIDLQIILYNIVNFKLRIISMSESTVKKQLLEVGDHSPNKVLVTRDINSWNQTHQKKNKVTINSHNNSIKITRKLPFKCTQLPPKNVPNSNTQENEEQQTPNFRQLKRRKQELMKTVSNYKNWQKKSCEDTKPQTIENSSNASHRLDKNYPDFFVKLPLVHVSQFVAEEKQKISHQLKSIRPDIRLSPKCPLISAVTSRKSSLRRINRNDKQLPFTLLQDSKKRSQSNQINQIIQEKLHKNNFTGLLAAAISRKTSNVLLTMMEKEKMKIRA